MYIYIHAYISYVIIMIKGVYEGGGSGGSTPLPLSASVFLRKK